MRRGFTLIELLVVIAVVAVLAVTVVLTLNPAELLRQSRDATRISDMTVLGKSLAVIQADSGRTAMGSSSVVYVSLPDTSATCGNLGLPSPPAGWTYACVTSANLRSTGGTGWVPVNLAQLPSGSPLSALPVDPRNTTSSYYSYAAAADGTYSLNAPLESQKFLASVASRDGGGDPLRFESGSNVALLTSQGGLAGYWSFNEGTGTSAGDGSGNGNTGALVSGPAWQASGSCKSGACLSFDGSDDYVNVSFGPSLDLKDNFSAFLWFRGSSAAAYQGLIGWGQNEGTGANGGSRGLMTLISSGNLIFRGFNENLSSSASVTDNAWHHVGATCTSANLCRLYVDGAEVANGTPALTTFVMSHFRIGRSGYTSPEMTAGRIDEVRVYNRVLSPSEVAALHASY